jgi:hypothetical protein
VLDDEGRDAVEDRLQAQLRALVGAGLPPPVADGPQAPAAFVDDSVSARRCTGVDSYNLHGDTLRGSPDDSCLA